LPPINESDPRGSSRRARGSDAPVAIPPGLVVATIPLAAPAGAVTVFFGVEDDLRGPQLAVTFTRSACMRVCERV